MKPHACLSKLLKNLKLIILLPAPLSTSVFIVHFPILSVILGDLKFVLTHLIYCRGLLGQVPPSSPTASPVVTSFPQTQGWVQKKWMYTHFHKYGQHSLRKTTHLCWRVCCSTFFVFKLEGRARFFSKRQKRKD